MGVLRVLRSWEPVEDGDVILRPMADGSIETETVEWVGRYPYRADETGGMVVRCEQ